ncbi:SIR2 family protein [Aridibaculum aurantiacum]|uniref:SIR2 family protein n=1 Tax=Aridibaculum aurantiacum TaxID=2810307 RepID=UPI001A978CC5|nr:SIR2 family protein [Aridibaculum aurantiacum]
MTPELSILLGSGFSVPEGLPTVSSINNKLRNLKENDFYLTSAQTAGFYNSDWRDPNDWSSYTDKHFAQEFTTFYRDVVLNGDVEAFNYEVFYDYITDFLRYKKDDNRISKFCDEFRKPFHKKSFLDDDHNLVWRFCKILNQLVADLLVVPRFYEDVSYLNYPPYDPFFGFIRENLTDRTVNVHTLNHDLFFDHMANKHSDLWQNFTDGFSEYGSPYYGQISIDHKTSDGVIHKTYMVRLRFYTGDYDNKLRLFKLHGSIDNCILHNTRTGETVRVKRGFGVTDFYMERFDEEAKKYAYEAPFAENEPDYLTGTTEKIRQYNQPFYENLFTHFKKNLLNSNLLLVIGYGFQDKGINEFIENNFLIYNKPVVVIDINKPNSYIFQKYQDQITFSSKGATGVPFEEFMSWKK